MVLGGGGFLGSHLVDALLAAGHSVVVLDRPNLRHFRRFGPEERVTWLSGDALSPPDWIDAARGADVIYHLVSTTLPRSSNDDPSYDVESNLVRTIRMLDFLRDAQVGRVVFASSGGTVYGAPTRTPIRESDATSPLSSYGIVKLAVEKYLELYRVLHGLEYRALRISNPYGERQRPSGSQGAVTVFLDRARRRQPIEIWGDGSVVRDYLHVSDVAKALLLAGESDAAPRVLNIGSGQGVSLNDLIAYIERLLGRPVERAYGAGRPFDVPRSVLDIDLARRSLGWEPIVSLESGLSRTLSWLEADSGERRSGRTVSA
jgi:UDP-glucose 4-epimerase